MKIFITLVIILLLALILIKYNSSKVKFIYVVSDIDDERYSVLSKVDSRKAANILAKIKQNIHALNMYLQNNKANPEYKNFITYIDLFSNGIKNTKISEGSGTNGYTSYTVNKGEEMVFCVRDENKNIHDINLLMYVAIHEISHIACPEQGHTPLFSRIFAFMLSNAIRIGIYHKIDFSNYPAKYCGMTINESII